MKTLSTTIKHSGGPSQVRIITGGADGPDRWAIDYAKANGIAFKVYPAKWRIDDVYNPDAGLMRNTVIVAESDFVLAFYDGSSGGTYDSLFKCDWSGTAHEVVDES